MSFNKGKCEVLHLGQNNPTYLLDSKLNVSQQHVLEVKKASCILGGISKYVGRVLRELFFPLHAALLGLHLECCVQFWPLQLKKKEKHIGVSLVESHQNDDGGRGPWLREMGVFRLRAANI